MDTIITSPLLITKREDYSENSPENSTDSPRQTSVFDDSKTASTSSPKRSSRRATQKRVVQVPIRDVEGSRLKAEISSPPSDNWAWRKYGQKPIKGSPYPRGYYRCSSSKGCPARKQVERSREDPTMLLVTYSCEHNHPWPASRSNHHSYTRHSNPTTTTATMTVNVITTTSTSEEEEKPADLAEEKLGGDHHHQIGEAAAEAAHGFGWLSEYECTSSTMLVSPIMDEGRGGGGGDDDEIGEGNKVGGSRMREEDESLFADLGELPECSLVFRRRGVFEMDEERRRYSLAPWCGTTS